MRQPQRTFTPEFKQEAVHLLETSGKSGIVIAKDLGISDTILYRWRKELRTSVGAAFPGKGHQTELEEEVRRLRREVDALRQERDILKKAAAIFCTARGEVSVHCPTPEGVSYEHDPSGPRCLSKWLVCLEEARGITPPARRPLSESAHSADFSGWSWRLWQPACPRHLAAPGSALSSQAGDPLDAPRRLRRCEKASQDPDNR